MNNLKLITENQKLAFCMVSVAPLRNDSNDSAEIVSQLLFGEPVEVLFFSELWVKIRTILDGYEGFMDIKHLLPLTEKEFKKWLNEFSYQREFTKLISTPWGKQLTSQGSLISNEQNFKIGEHIFSQQIEKKIERKSPIEIAKGFLNVPYLWGEKCLWN